MVRLSLAFGLTSTLVLAALVPEAYRHRASGIEQQAPPAPPPLPSIDLPPELDRVLRDYEKHWKASNGEALSALFTDDGFINRNGWIRGRDAIRQAYARSGGDLRLRALAFAADDTVGYIIGGYRYGEATIDGGKFILALRRAPQREWKIAADLDAANRQ
ncbi:MAG TPA: nuclear transport factor 2 family protein [Gemmatimonadaceae bacterium]